MGVELLWQPYCPSPLLHQLVCNLMTWQTENSWRYIYHIVGCHWLTVMLSNQLLVVGGFGIRYKDVATLVATPGLTGQKLRILCWNPEDSESLKVGSVRVRILTYALSVSGPKVTAVEALWAGTGSMEPGRGQEALSLNTFICYSSQPTTCRLIQYLVQRIVCDLEHNNRNRESTKWN